MVFGQARQDDLIAYLQEHVGQEEAERLAKLARVNLAPKDHSVPAFARYRWVGELSRPGLPVLPTRRAPQKFGSALS
jgi:hypothetical protein